MRTPTIAEVTATKIRVDMFGMQKHTSRSATKNLNITTLSYGVEREGYRKISSKKGARRQQTYAHISSAQGRLKIMIIGSSPNLR